MAIKNAKTLSGIFIFFHSDPRMAALVKPFFECPLGKLPPPSVSSALAPGTIRYGRGVGNIILTGKIIKPPRITPTARSTASLLLFANQRQVDAKSKKIVEPVWVTADMRGSRKGEANPSFNMTKPARFHFFNH